MSDQDLSKSRRLLAYNQQRFDSLVVSLIGTTNVKTVPERAAGLMEAHVNILKLQEQIFDDKLAALRRELSAEIDKLRFGDAS
jgi:hypothetical protein